MFCYVQAAHAMHRGTHYPIPGTSSSSQGMKRAGDGHMGFAAPRRPGAFGICLGGEEPRQQNSELCAK